MAWKTEFPDRNTSTDVEKTSFTSLVFPPSQKHLHGRGEDNALEFKSPFFTETPPRTWRRLTLDYDVAYTIEKHLHGRGEDALRR